MVVSYDEFTTVFLDKIREYEFLSMEDEVRTEIIDGYMIRAFTEFKKNLHYNFLGFADNVNRQFDFSNEPQEVQDKLADDLTEIVNIVTDGMCLQWMKPYKNSQENLENVLNTRDFTLYSPAELLKQVRTTYKSLSDEYKQEIREYSFNHMDLEELHT